MMPIFGRTEIKCAQCGTSLIRIVSAQFDKLVCPTHLGVDNYREGATDTVDLMDGPIVDGELIGHINRFWLTGRQPV
jgi:hypothetical protein